MLIFVFLSTYSDREWKFTHIDDKTTLVRTQSASKLTSNVQINISVSSSKLLLITLLSKVTCSCSLFLNQVHQNFLGFCQLASLKKTVKLLQQIQWKNKSIQDLRDLLKMSKDEKSIDNVSEQPLIDKLNGTNLNIFQNTVKNKIRKATGSKFSDKVKKIPLTIHCTPLKIMSKQCDS